MYCGLQAGEMARLPKPADWAREQDAEFDTVFPRSPDKVRSSLASAFGRPASIDERSALMRCAHTYTRGAQVGSLRAEFAIANERATKIKEALERCAQTLFDEISELRDCGEPIYVHALDDIEAAVASNTCLQDAPSPIAEMSVYMRRQSASLDQLLKNWNEKYHTVGPEGDGHLHKLISEVADIYHRSARRPDQRRPLHALIRSVLDALPAEVDHGKSSSTLSQTIKDVLSGRRKRKILS
jgi:hypothetical protein